MDKVSHICDSSATDHAAEVRAWLEARAGEMAALLEELVAVDTENPPGRGLGRCGRVLHGAMERLGLSGELIELPPRAELEHPCIVRGSVGDGPEPSTSTGTSTSCRRRIAGSSSRSDATDGSSGAAPPT